MIKSSDFVPCYLPIVQPTYRIISGIEFSRPVTTLADAIAAVASDIAYDVSETAIFVAVDATGKPICCSALACGQRGEADVEVRALYNFVLATNASKVVMVHNHPSGVVFPSQQDIEQAEKLNYLLAIISVPLEDSVVCGADGKGGVAIFSLATHRKYRLLKADGSNHKQILKEGSKKFYNELTAADSNEQKRTSAKNMVNELSDETLYDQISLTEGVLR